MTKDLDDTSQALIKAAHEILDMDGPEGLTVRRLATQANMSTMNVYSRFDGKHGVINQLYISGFRSLAERLSAVETTDDGRADLLTLLMEYRAFSIEYSSYYRVMFGSSTVPNFEPTEEAIEIAFSSLSTVAIRVQRGYDQNEFQPVVGWNAEEVAAWLWSVAHGAVSLEVYGVGAERIKWGSLYETGVRTAIEGVVSGDL